MLYSQKKYPPFHWFRMKLTHYLLVPLPLLLKLPLTWCRCSDFLQGNEPIPGLYQKAGLALSGPIRKQAGRPQRQLPHRHFVAAQKALSHPTTTNKEGMVTFVIKGHKGVNTRTQQTMIKSTQQAEYGCSQFFMKLGEWDHNIHATKHYMLLLVSKGTTWNCCFWKKIKARIPTFRPPTVDPPCNQSLVTAAAIVPQELLLSQGILL